MPHPRQRRKTCREYKGHPKTIKGEFIMTVETEIKDVKVEREEGQEEQGGSDNTKKEEEKERSYTQEEVEKMISDRVAREKRNAEKAIQESEKLAKMSADQKREYEFEKLKKENEELKAAQTRNELGKEATKILADSGIIANDEILSFVVREDAEKTNQSVEAFTNVVNSLVDNLVKEKLKGNAPKRQQGGIGALTKEEILKEKDATKRQQLIKENNHLFR